MFTRIKAFVSKTITIFKRIIIRIWWGIPVGLLIGILLWFFSGGFAFHVRMPTVVVEYPQVVRPPYEPVPATQPRPEPREVSKSCASLIAQVPTRSYGGKETAVAKATVGFCLWNGVDTFEYSIPFGKAIRYRADVRSCEIWGRVGSSVRRCFWKGSDSVWRSADYD